MRVDIYGKDNIVGMLELGEKIQLMVHGKELMKHVDEEVMVVDLNRNQDQVEKKGKVRMEMDNHSKSKKT